MLRAAALAAAMLSCAAAAADARSGVVRDGPARFVVLTPSLIRLEYAADGRFEDRPTQTTGPRRAGRAPRFTTRVSRGERIIRTRLLTLRYRRGSGPFGAGNLRVAYTLGATRTTVTPRPGSGPQNLGGWTRGLDNSSGPVALNDGLLARSGWYVLDDSRTVLLTGDGFVARPAREGPYQDWYLFAYGRDYARALRDLRRLTGPAPLLPRNAFGVWFSRYYPYSAAELQALVAEIRGRGMPLDMLSIDTDFKRVADPAGAAVAAAVAGAPGRPYSWNGWDWNHELFPDPKGFADWAHAQGLQLAVNIHPTINSNDPRYPATVARTGPLRDDGFQCRVLQADVTGVCKVFDWTDPRQLAAYLDLHDFIERAGIDLLWLDWCCDGPQRDTPGLTNDTWINARYAARQRARGKRWPAFSRIGGTFLPDAHDGDRTVGNGGAGALAEHRSAVHFTGDTCATWDMLRFQAQLTAAEGNIGMPYVSHDIGSFNGEPLAGSCSTFQASLRRTLPDELYARWVQLGTFQPIDRLHSNHGDRLPWQYGPAAARAALEALQLRAALVPYTYTLARRAHDTGLPIAGALYVQWPDQPGAYEHPSQFTFGPDIVVAPVTVPGDPAPVTVWVPPGTWIDRDTGERYSGPRAVTVRVPLARIPVLVRAGAVLVTHPLVVDAYPGRRGAFTLYDDAGDGFAHERGAHTRTPITQTRRGRHATVAIGPARGRFAGAPRRRSWRLRFRDIGAAGAVRMTVGGRSRRPAAEDRIGRTVTVDTGPVTSSQRLVVSVRQASAP